MGEKKELTREEMLELEERAIQHLLQAGVKFSVPLKFEPGKPPKLILWWNRHFPRWAKVWKDKRIPRGWTVSLAEIADIYGGKTKEVYMRNFQIKPLYGGTICALRKLYLQIEIDKNPDEPTRDVFKYWPVMAEIAAVAVLNDTSAIDALSGQVKELKQFFIDHLTNARLQKLVNVIAQMMDKAGFTSSIRSIQGVGITLPKASRIE
jgi:hypothetical protein